MIKFAGEYNAFGYWIRSGFRIIYSAEVHNGNEEINRILCGRRLEKLCKELKITSAGVEQSNEYFFTN